jgi:adenine-specific DNA-methyltransferase
MLGVDEDDELIDTLKQDRAEYTARQSFPQMILDNLKTAGVQQAHKEDRITFTALTRGPANLVCAEGAISALGTAMGTEKRAASSSAPSSAPCSAPTWSPPPARRAMPASMC